MTQPSDEARSAMRPGFHQWANGFVDRRAARRIARLLLCATLAGLAFALLGPFGSYLNGGLPTRAAYWVGASWTGCLLYGGSVAVAGRILPGRWSARPAGRWALLATVVMVASLAQAALTRAAALALWPDLRRHDPGWWAWLAQTVMLGVVAVAAFERWNRRLPRHHAPQQAPSATGPSRIQRPVILPAGVIALQMEDHYVRAHTRNGSTLIHLPMTRAIAEIAAAEGLRIHRSWWVARDAVMQIDGPARTMRVLLCNGVSAPVARSAVATLREAGWLSAGAKPL